MPETQAFEHFFIVGAQRAGTTYLAEILDEHPSIEMAKPIKPEPKFFLLDDCYSQGVDFYGERFFGEKPGAKLRGEKSTSYMESGAAAMRIARHFPGAKILFILRNPVERAVSNYFFSVNNGLEKLPMEPAFLQEEERWRKFDRKALSVSPFAYLRRGRYSDFIGLFEKSFPRDQIKILVFEDLVGNPEKIAGVYRFLGADASFKPKKINSSINQGSREAYSLSDHLRRYLEDYFSNSNAELKRKYGLDLSRWEL